MTSLEVISIIPTLETRIEAQSDSLQVIQLIKGGPEVCTEVCVLNYYIKLVRKLFAKNTSLEAPHPPEHFSLSALRW